MTLSAEYYAVEAERQNCGKSPTHSAKILFFSRTYSASIHRIAEQCSKTNVYKVKAKKDSAFFYRFTNKKQKTLFL